MKCLPGASFSLPAKREALHAHEVVVEHRPAVEQVEAPAVEASALRRDHAVRAAGGNLHVGADLERFVLEVRRGAFGNARLAGEVGEHAAPAREAGADADVEALDRAVVEREHVVLGGLDPEQVLQLAQLRGLLVGEVHGLAEVLGDVVELPLVVIARPASAPATTQGATGGVVAATQPSL